MTRAFSVLQANMNKQQGAQLSLLNDESLVDFSFLLLSEPSTVVDNEGRVLPIPRHHSYWTAILPSTHNQQHPAVRSMIWVHNSLQVRQIPVQSPDITAVLTQVEDTPTLVLSVYIPPKEDTVDVALTQRLALMDETIRKVRQELHKDLPLLITGDFNRHDQLWGGDHIGSSQRQGEGEAIIEFMLDHDLQSLLPRGTITFESSQGQSTIDLILASPTLYDVMLSCQVHRVEHGSDHRSIESTFTTHVQDTPFEPRLLFRNAPWSRIKRAVAEAIQPSLELPLPMETEAILNIIMDAVLPAINQFVPKSKPSPYAKCWWTLDLTQMRRDYTHFRNRASAARRAGSPRPDLQRQAEVARKTYYKAIWQ